MHELSITSLETLRKVRVINNFIDASCLEYTNPKQKPQIDVEFDGQ